MRSRLGHPHHHILVQLCIRIVVELMVAVPQLLGSTAGHMLLVAHCLVVSALLGLLLRVDLVADGVRPAFDLLGRGSKIIIK